MHGFGARLGSQIATALGIRTVDELRAAAAAGRLREVPGIGPRTEERIREALERGGAAAERPLLLHRARALSEQLAAALGGIPAGDARRWREASTRLAVVVVTERPDEVRARFQALPEIVTLAEPDLGVTLEGVPVELVLAPPETLGTALVRATGSPEYVASLGPLPEAPDEETVYRLLGLPYLPPELRELPPPPGEPPALVELEQIRGDLHCHTVWSDGKATVLEMGEAARALGYEYLAICDHTSNLKVVPGPDRGRPPSPGRGDRRRERAAGAVPGAARHRVRHPPRRLARPPRRHPRRARLGADLAARRPARAAAGADRARDPRDAPPGGALPQPPDRAPDRPPPRERARPRRDDRDRTRDRRRARGERPARPARPERRARPRVRSRPASAIVCSTDGHAPASLGYMPLSVHTARRGGATAADVLNTRPLSGDPQDSSG